MSKLLHYLFHRPTWQKLPMLPRMYSTEYDPATVDQDTQMLMRLTHTRCPQGVEILKKRYRLKTARALIEQLPQRKRKRRVLYRAFSLVRRAFGLLPYDPMRSIYRQHMRRAHHRSSR